jgi:hypothetical protein
MASVTRKSLADQRQWAGKQDAKKYLRASLGASAKADLENDDSNQSRAALLEAGRSFKDMVQTLYKQQGLGNSAQESEEKMFIAACSSGLLQTLLMPLLLQIGRLL